MHRHTHFGVVEIDRCNRLFSIVSSLDSMVINILSLCKWNSFIRSLMLRENKRKTVSRQRNDETDSCSKNDPAETTNDGCLQKLDYTNKQRTALK